MSSILCNVTVSYLYIPSGVKAIQLVQQLQHGSLNFPLPTRVAVIPVNSKQTIYKNLVINILCVLCVHVVLFGLTVKSSAEIQVEYML